MNAAMENYNYWNDRRVQAGMVDKGKIVQEKNGEHVLVIMLEDDEGVEEELRLKCKYEVCPTCQGKGTHVNPSIDCCGLTAEEFYDDPEFAEDYMNGFYDQECNECKGLRVVPMINRNEGVNKKEDIKRYDDHMEAEWDYARTCAAERAMGA